jgi:hypothetical protein
MPMHTPGPWRYEPATKTIRSVPANYWLASLDSWDGAVNHEANAALIAAAPDLLNAVEYLLTIITRNEPRLLGMMEVDYARAALLKATGG